MSVDSDSDFDLDLYLERVGLDAAPAVDLAGLAAVQRAQLLSVPFENLDVLLGRGIDVDPAAVFEKLVVRRRGGYCFECNQLLRDALLALGFDARIALGRVVFGRAEDGPVPPRTHAVVVVRLGSRQHVVDCGFGGPTPRGVLSLPEGVARDIGSAWRVRSDPPFGLRLTEAPPDGAPRDLYVFDLAPAYPADLALGNHWTSTHPSSHFMRNLMAVRHTPDGRIVLDGRTLVERRDGAAARTQPISDAGALVRIAGDVLGIPLDVTPEQATRLWDAAGSA